MLNLSWIAFFLTFVVWFNLGAVQVNDRRALHLSEAQMNTLLICNVALTIPARIAIGMLVDRFGPKRVYTGLLLAVAIPCLFCATATHYWQLVIGRLLVSCVGADSLSASVWSVNGLTPARSDGPKESTGTR